VQDHQWRFLKFLNLFTYGDNEIQIRENMPHKISTKSLEKMSQFIALRKLGFIIFMVRHVLVGQGFRTVEASRSHSDTLHSVGLLWTSDQPDTQTSV
jgi:hypothetical protein